MVAEVVDGRWGCEWPPRLLRIEESNMSANKMSESTVLEVQANLAFSKPEEAIKDDERRGMKRALTRPIDAQFETQFEKHSCVVRDLCQPQWESPTLQSAGFETLDLSGNSVLQNLLSKIRQAGELQAEDARALRRQLRGAIFHLHNGSRLKMLSIAPEGMIMRTGGPNGLQVEPDKPVTEMNGHDVALAVHGDQDVRGTPLKQMMRGFAPLLFRHRTPDGNNRVSPLMLTNVWIPLQQITRPLALMDRRTLNNTAHQLRYALPTDTFLDRDEDRKNNDIWMFQHDAAQQWYFHSQMGHDKAYIFDTLGEPHGSFILPGEDVAEVYFKQLRAWCDALVAGVACAPMSAEIPPLPDDTPAPLRQAIVEMANAAAQVPAANTTEQEVAHWVVRAEAATAPLVRRSLEMRMVSVLLPNAWPFNREPAAVG